MQPKHLPIGDGLLEDNVEFPEPFAQASAPISPASHPHKIIRQRQQEKYPEENVVKSTQSESLIHFGKMFRKNNGVCQANSWPAPGAFHNFAYNLTSMTK
jgi:hypothetical protein